MTHVNPTGPQQDLFDPLERKVLEFVRRWHGRQRRKYTGAPYDSHLIAVARQVKEMTQDTASVIAALCHDLYEDTACTEEELLGFLRSLGLKENTVRKINQMVWELTDRFVPETYPHLSRRERKAMEAQRLGGISPEAQTVKLADLLDNTRTIVQNDPGFARTYLREARDIFQRLDRGHPTLRRRLQAQLQQQGELLDGEERP
ncbi:MAG: bifunctional (p)ppGpp synthetase/guanosine-3',5'-bis(diphosphate) 3'-pyrophosphohydrolase [Bacteroidetes bacterium]|nr:MAG: bifunctional (p)ppGpp synthetase/guanosine-3',5'-bis(diphosphate) 3'-pyrophosphohydrolase [Bacteroidota bacterium]